MIHEEYKNLGCNFIDKFEDKLNELATFLHKNPELGYKEYKSHDYLTKFLEDFEFQVERNYLHETGFRAVYKTAETPHFVILVEYDALPNIGQACGHNIIAQSSVATAIGLKEVIKQNIHCKITVLGTPAEEGGGGKLKFIDSGLFNDVDLAIMSHPFKYDLVYLPFLAIVHLKVTFLGKESHASVAPWMGKNALDAAVLAYQSISCLRQQVHPNCRIHGIITKGGEAANIIPNLTAMEYFIRAPTIKMLQDLLPRIKACFTSAGLATDCEAQIEDFSALMYTDIIPNTKFQQVFRKNAEWYGVKFKDEQTIESCLTGSSDAGNVSYVVPTIHPMFYIGTDAENHTVEFAKCADGGKIRKKVMERFHQRTKRQPPPTVTIHYAKVNTIPIDLKMYTDDRTLTLFSTNINNAQNDSMILDNFLYSTATESVTVHLVHRQLTISFTPRDQNIVPCRYYSTRLDLFNSTNCFIPLSSMKFDIIIFSVLLGCSNYYNYLLIFLLLFCIDY